MFALECALKEASAETVRRLWRQRASSASTASERGRVAELAYAASAGLAVWSTVPRHIRAAIHGNGRATTRDRGVDAVGMCDGRLVLVQVKWYREGASVSGDADMKLALIAAVAQRALHLDEPPRAILVVRRGARTTRTSPGTTLLEYVELTDEDIGLSGPSGLNGLSSHSGLARAAPMAVCHAGQFEHFRYVPKARDVQKRSSEI